MEWSKQSVKCAVCQIPINMFQRKRCSVCKLYVCSKCCYHEKGIMAILRHVNKLPNKICLDCLQLQQQAEEQKAEEVDQVRKTADITNAWMKDLSRMFSFSLLLREIGYY